MDESKAKTYKTITLSMSSSSNNNNIVKSNTNATTTNNMDNKVIKQKQLEIFSSQICTNTLYEYTVGTVHFHRHAYSTKSFTWTKELETITRIVPDRNSIFWGEA